MQWTADQDDPDDPKSNRGVLVLNLALILIVVGTAAWVVLPLTRTAALSTGATGGLLGELEARRRELLFALQDLDFELETGKLSTADHADLKARLQAEAVEVLSRIDGAASANAAAG
jgi:hypothetical protein